MCECRAGTAVKTAHNPLNEEEARDLAEFDKDDIGTHRYCKLAGCTLGNMIRTVLYNWIIPLSV